MDNLSNFIILYDEEQNLYLFDLNDIINYKMIFNGDSLLNNKETLNEELNYKKFSKLKEKYGNCQFDNISYPNILFLANNKITILDLKSNDYNENLKFLLNSDYNENYEFNFNKDITQIELDSKGIIIHSFNNIIYFYDIKLIKDKEIFKLEFNSNVLHIKLLDPNNSILFIMLIDKTISIDYSNFNVSEEEMIISMDDKENTINYDLDVNYYQKGCFMVCGENNNENCNSNGILKIIRDNKIIEN